MHKHLSIKTVKFQYWLVQIIQCYNMCTDIRGGKKMKATAYRALKTKLGRVIFGGNKNNKTLGINAFWWNGSYGRLNYMVYLKSKVQASCQTQSNELLTFHKKQLLIKIVDIPLGYYGIVTAYYWLTIKV